MREYKKQMKGKRRGEEISRYTERRWENKGSRWGKKRIEQ